jgi:hypothetical protein
MRVARRSSRVDADSELGGAVMTLLWLVVWFVSDRIGDREAILFDPPNLWAATLLLAAALDLNRPQLGSRKR